MTTALLESAEGETKYVTRPDIEPRTSDLRLWCLTDCATQPGWKKGKGKKYVKVPVGENVNSVTRMLISDQCNDCIGSDKDPQAKSHKIHVPQ